MVELIQLTKIFNPNTSSEVYGLDQCSLAIPNKEFLILIGSNGSGKSTLLNLISGGIKPDRGQIFLEQNEVTQWAEYSRSRWVAHIFQNPLFGTAPDMSILDNFRLASLRTRPKGLHFGITDQFKNKVRDTISRLGMGLENKLGQEVGTLSGGQRQALALVMAVMDDAKILLLDEPTAALDVHSSETVLLTAQQLIRDFNLTAVMVTHNLRDVLRFGDRIIQMEQGKIKRDIHKKESPGLSLPELYSWMD